VADSNFINVGSFLKTKKDNMLVGVVDAEQLEALKGVIKDGIKAGTGIVFFFFKNQPGSRVVARLTAAVSRPREQAPPDAGVRSRPIASSGQAAASPKKKSPLDDLFSDAPAEKPGEEEDEW